MVLVPDASLASIAETLRDSAIFGSFDDLELSSLYSIASTHAVAAGEFIIRKGQISKSFYFLLSGSVDVLTAYSGSVSPFISRLKTGQVFGEFGLCEIEQRTADVLVHEDARFLEFSYDRLFEVAKRKPRLGLKVFQGLASELSGKLRNTTENLISLVLSSRLVALGQMALFIGHEVTNPLTAIQLELDEIEGAANSDIPDPICIMNSVQRSKRAIDRAVKIIRALKWGGRDSRNDPKTRVNLSELVHDTAELCLQKCKKDGIELQLPALSVAHHAHCSPVEVSQVILNLLSNACYAVNRQTEKWIQIDVDELPNWLVLSVTDSGPGVQARDRIRIFGAFFTTKPPGEGTGLGLSISKQIAEAHGGELDLDPDSPHTRFRLFLPKNSEGTNAGPA